MGHLLVISDWGHECSALSFKVTCGGGRLDGKGPGVLPEVRGCQAQTPLIAHTHTVTKH